MKAYIKLPGLAISLTALLATGGCANVSAPATKQSAGTECNTRELQGRYIATGSLTSASDRNGRAVSAYMQAYFVFDGTGSLQVERGLSSGHGKSVAWEGDGHYSIRPDCSGSMSLSTRIAEDREVTMDMDFLLRHAPDGMVVESIFVAHPGKTSGQLTLKRQGRPRLTGGASSSPP